MEPNPSSSRRTQANRSNAQHSTGPRTGEGKARSATNARTHGLCSDVLLAPGEDAAELEHLKKRYVFQIEPSTPIEITLCDQLISAAWKLRRIASLEDSLYSRTGSFELLLDDDKLQKTLDSLARHQSRIERSYYRALRDLGAQQTNRLIFEKEHGMPTSFNLADARHFAKRTHAARAAAPTPPPDPAFEDTEPPADAVEEPLSWAEEPAASVDDPVSPVEEPVASAQQSTSPEQEPLPSEEEPFLPEEEVDLESIFAAMDELFLPARKMKHPETA